MAPAFHAFALSLVYLLWSACRRAQQPPPAGPAADDQPPGGDERVEHRLDCLAVLMQPRPRRR